jgi:hypothetical protein
VTSSDSVYLWINGRLSQSRLVHLEHLRQPLELVLRQRLMRGLWRWGALLTLGPGCFRHFNLKMEEKEGPLIQRGVETSKLAV